MSDARRHLYDFFLKVFMTKNMKMKTTHTKSIINHTMHVELRMCWSCCLRTDRGEGGADERIGRGGGQMSAAR